MKLKKTQELRQVKGALGRERERTKRLRAEVARLFNELVTNQELLTSRAFCQ